jgi:myosin heavy subunit
MSTIKAGNLVWIENPYGSNNPVSLVSTDTVGPVDDDPKSKYREGWCPATYSERPVYVPGIVKDVDQDGTVTITTALEPTITVTRSVQKDGPILMRSNTAGDGVNDCLYVENDNLAEIMWMLMKRYIRDQPYTMCGSNVVVSVNPNKPVVLGKLIGHSDPWASLRGALIRADRTTGNRLIDVFDYAVQRVYSKLSQNDLPPHLYSVAKIALDNITKKRIKSQIVICSGIPGMFCS